VAGRVDVAVDSRVALRVRAEALLNPGAHAR
jgi:hypothetical protein